MRNMHLTTVKMRNSLKSVKNDLAYLRRESVTVGPEVPKGIVVMAYKGLLLGPAKNIGSRVNNLYPKNWRILMR